MSVGSHALKETIAPERLLTAREVADRLGVSVEWTLRHYRAGELPGFRIGRSVRPVRFRWSEIETWLDECRNDGLSRNAASLTEAPS
jgi:excisionase family DNA binding protein